MPTSTLMKWGNSQGVIIPKALCEELGMQVGDRIAMDVVDGELRAKPSKDYTIQSLLADYDGPKPEYVDYFGDWGGPVGRELW